MKRFHGSLALLACCCFCAATFAFEEETPATEPDNAVGSQTIEFAGQTLVLAWQGENLGETIKEFIPAGEKLESWTQLASIRKYPELHDVQQLAGNLVRAIREQNKAIPVQLLENQEADSAIVSFLIWPGKGPLKDAEFVEYNVFKYEKDEAGGIVALQYAIRAYDDLETFLTELEPRKARLIQEMAESGLTVIDDDSAESADESPDDAAAEDQSDTEEASDDSDTDDSDTDDSDPDDSDPDDSDPDDSETDEHHRDDA